MKKLFKYFALLLLLLAFVSCKKETTESSSKIPHKPITVPPPAEAAENYTGKVKIKTTDDKPVVEIKFKGAEDAKLEFSGLVVRAKNKDNGKRKYELEGAGIIAEVKDGDDGFKLRTADGKLLWKVKFGDDKIKISDNEENNNPYELKPKGDDRVKVEKNNSELGEVKFYKDRQKVKVKVNEAEKYESNTDLYSSAYGVLVIDAIPERERNILIAELLMRKK
ncbi:MAG: hypothetical protein C5B54_04470 [Acidobacteria bacterium]|nr:MAG: hypothetical protein C5B54_04470 [Acidobacteriota bacterium]